MPQGKGTYGSQVGRPPKKSKYKDGGEIDPFSTKNPESIMAQKKMESIEALNALPEINAQERSETYQLGGIIEPPTSPSITPQVPSYKKGGEVEDIPQPKRSLGAKKKKGLKGAMQRILPGGKTGYEKEKIKTTITISPPEKKEDTKLKLAPAIENPTVRKATEDIKRKYDARTRSKKKEGGKVDSTKAKYIKKGDVIKYKTAGFNKAEKKRKAKEKAQKGMTPSEKIAAYKAKQAKADTTKPKSALQRAKEFTAKHEAMLKKAKKGKK